MTNNYIMTKYNEITSEITYYPEGDPQTGTKQAIHIEEKEAISIKYIKEYRIPFWN